MANSIKYNTSNESNALTIGNMHIGTGDIPKGPTSSTGFYNGINPPNGGYTIYIHKATEGSSIYTPSSDAELILMTNQIAGATYTTINECFSYFAGQSGKFVIQHTTNSMVTSDLSLYLDAAQLISYPRSGTSWKDLSGESNNGVLTNGVTFNSAGYMDFDGNDDYCAIDTYTFGNGNWTVNAWVNGDVLDNHNLISNTSGGPVTNAFGFDNSKIHYRNYDGSWKNHDGNTTLTSGKWYMLTWVNYAGATSADGTMKMYVNGVADSSVFNSYTVNGGPCNAIGRNWGSTEYDGRIANIQFYTESLTDAEVIQNYYGAPDVPNNPKIVVNRAQKGVTVTDSGIGVDLAKVYDNTQTWGYANSDLNGDFDGLTNFTYFLWLHCYSHHTNYSQTSFYKYAGTSTAVVRLYDFGNYNGNNAQANNNFYANANGSWTSIGTNFTLAVGETACICLQYDSSGGDTWKNGVKIGTNRGGGTIATNTANLNIITPEYGGEQYVRVKEAYVYTETLTDQQIIDLYNATSMKYV